MDRFDHAGSADPRPTPETPRGASLSMAAIRQQLSELRRQARRQDHEALAKCLSLALAIATPKRTN